MPRSLDAGSTICVVRVGAGRGDRARGETTDQCLKLKFVFCPIHKKLSARYLLLQNDARNER